MVLFLDSWFYFLTHGFISLCLDVMPLAYILAGVLAGILLLIVVGVAVFLYHRRMREGSDSGSEDSSSNIKKRDGSPDIKVEYKGQ